MERSRSSGILMEMPENTREGGRVLTRSILGYSAFVNTGIKHQLESLMGKRHQELFPSGTNCLPVPPTLMAITQPFGAAVLEQHVAYNL